MEAFKRVGTTVPGGPAAATTGVSFEIIIIVVIIIIISVMNAVFMYNIIMNSTVVAGVKEERGSAGCRGSGRGRCGRTDVAVDEDGGRYRYDDWTTWYIVFGKGVTSGGRGDGGSGRGSGGGGGRRERRHCVD